MPKKTKDEGGATDEGGKLEPTETGHYVYLDGELNSGPYESEADADAFNQGHLDGRGEVRHYAAEEND